MKQVLRITIMAFVMFLFTFAACENDEDTPDPTLDLRDDIAIKWSCSSLEGDSPAEYDVYIKKSEVAKDEVILVNFDNTEGNEAVAVMNGNKLTFKTQVIQGYNLSGEGIISDNLQKISWTYVLNDGFDPPRNITATFSSLATAKKRGI